MTRMNRLWYGGDYNPEQWPREVWDDDVRLMQAAGVTVATVGVFSWAKLEPEDGRFEFEWLDDILGRLHAGGIRIDLATATASPPPWLALAHPEILPISAEGVRLEIGSRQHYSPSSAVYRRYADRLVRAIAERYRDHPGLEAWHVNNELACHVRHDYSDESAAAFRAWLVSRYGSIPALNDAWGTAFWSQGYGSFAEIMPPRAMPTFPNPTQQLDWDRFSSDAWLGVYRAEATILREVSPGVPITTNFMGFFTHADYWAWAREVDFVSDDHYVDPADPASPAFAAMTRDLMRSLGGGAPWILMEQSTSAVNWRARNAPKPPGMYRSLSLQAVARGADGIMQFQWRQSKAGAEKFHSGMVPHAGVNSRVFRETVELGTELAGLADVVGSRLRARVALLLDWDSWWALEQQATPAQLSYVDTLFRWYRELWRRGVLVDFVHPDGELSGYELVIAAGAVVLPDAAQHRLADFVTAGGHVVVGYQSAILDENLHVILDGYLGALREVLGIRIEEFAPPAEPSLSGGQVQALAIDGLGAGPARVWAEVVEVVENSDGSDALVMSRFTGGSGGASGADGRVGSVGRGWLDGMPAVTRRAHGRGVAWYLATAPDELGAIVDAVLAGSAIGARALMPDDLEVIERGGRRFLLNHSDVVVEFDGVTLPPRGSVVVSAPPGDTLSP